MKDLYRVFLIGLQDGKPQKGLVTWMSFVHPGEERAEELGRTLARRLTVRTGHPVSYQVEPIAFVEYGEGDLLRMADELVDLYPHAVDQDRTVLEFTTALVEGAGGAGLAVRLVEELRDAHSVDLDDWLLMDERKSDEDRNPSSMVVCLSLPAMHAERLLSDRALVEAYGIRRGEHPSSASLYDDDARMEEIAADAEDAAIHAWGALGNPQRRPNPHPEGSEEAEYWNTTFWSAYARENGK